MTILAVSVTSILAWTGAASAQGRLDARYEASLAGIPVGKGTWAIDIADDQFSASANGASTGIMKAFAGGHGTGASQGRIVNGQLAPSNYAATIASDKKSETIRILLLAGNIKDTVIEPSPEPSPDRIPVTDAHRRGVIDPMTGSLVRVAGSGELLGPDACKSNNAIFDGRMRYDLRLDYKRLETVKVRGYQGQVVVCAIYFKPISGYIPERAALKYLAAQRDMEVWLAPIAGTRVLAPLKVMVPTPIGMAALEATQFVSTAVVRTTAKTQ
ncbi:DUF3108 domain-containing protein [Bradyrhizobium prioriisuperbiae]|uniref:DUF3108 domain-containing protein n=1 Tax=Bradyrhizobium prioriisuperbiae TaxID=2854389 RepID=UPI0028E237EC|nr:DUF3108 domain-containing protein [Bradyrhizobium prioritasuperba]